ncbi:hypothetical protein J6590_050211, partial [Homalodisca vitripennis]
PRTVRQGAEMWQQRAEPSRGQWAATQPPSRRRVLELAASYSPRTQLADIFCPTVPPYNTFFTPDTCA